MIGSLSRRLASGDFAWLAIFVGVAVFELTADDLLSDATERYCGRHPWLTRVFITAVAGHLACVLPEALDVFSSNNVVHKWAFAHYPLARVDRQARQVGRLATAVAAADVVGALLSNEGMATVEGSQ